MQTPLARKTTEPVLAPQPNLATHLVNAIDRALGTESPVSPSKRWESFGFAYENNVQLPKDLDLSTAPVLKRPLARAKERRSDLVGVPSHIIRSLVARIPKGKLVTQDEIEQLVQTVEIYDRVHEVMMQNIDVNASREWKSLSKKFSTLVAEGNSAEAQKLEFPGKERFMEQAALKRKALKQRLRDLSASVQPIQLAVAKRIAAVARASAVEEEAKEISRSEAWGFPEFSHSKLIHWLDLLARRPEVIAPPGHVRGSLAFTCEKELSNLQSQVTAGHPEKKENRITQNPALPESRHGNNKKL